MRVSVIGAGMGGLALAQALHRADIDVVVHERDAHVAATGGYRLVLDAPACETLRGALGPERYQALAGSSAPAAASRRFTLADHRLRPLSEQRFDPAEESLFVGRAPLRRLLAEGMGDRVRFGVSYRAHEVRPDGRVVVHFDDGGSEVCDVLVGADGARSRVAADLAGRPLSVPSAYGCTAGRIPLDEALRRRLPAVLDGGPALAYGPGGLGMFLTLHDPAAGATVDSRTCREVEPIVEPPALIWGLIGPRRVLRGGGDDPPAGDALVQRGLAALRRWSPRLRDLVADSDPATTSYFGYHSCDPDGDLTPWSAGPVTALGDAVHAMPPTGGGAAATAIRDAGHLAAQLVAARDGATTIPLATLAFQRTMAGYAPGRVREALALLRSMQRLSGPVAGAAAGVVLPALAARYRLRRGGVPSAVTVGVDEHRAAS